MVIKMSGINIDTVGYSDVDNMTTHIPLSLSLHMPCSAFCMYVYVCIPFHAPDDRSALGCLPPPPPNRPIVPITRWPRRLRGEGREGGEVRGGRGGRGGKPQPTHSQLTRTCQRMYVCMYVCMYGWMDGWMDVCMYVWGMYGQALAMPFSGIFLAQGVR